MRASVHASCFSRTDVCLEAEGISCLPLAQAQGQAKQLLLSQKKNSVFAHEFATTRVCDVCHSER